MITMKIIIVIFLVVHSFSRNFIHAFYPTRSRSSIGQITSRRSTVIATGGIVEKSAGDIKNALLRFSLTSNRGEIASPVEKNQIQDFVERLESMNPTLNPVQSENCIGEWDLIYSDTQLFRSSPFFLAARAVCKDGEEADRFNLFCGLHRSALAFTSIGHVRQIITPEYFRHEFEATGALLPGLPLVVKGTIMSTASIESTTGNSWRLRLQSVRIKRSTSNIPLGRNFLDNFEGVPVEQMASFLQRNVDRYETPTPVFRTSYVDEDFRISRDQDDHIFVYTRAQCAA